ncbi:hypothetical protein ACIRL2_45885 [Embleya sp. NPDC127516]|uniref:hypothetical protein n=1 Tax=Embleya sp. NPDC127516 TaxID=3363990 RepID=UPI0037F3B06B
MSSGARHYVEAERLAKIAHQYNQGNDPVKGRAWATEALVHATLANAAAEAARITPDDVDPGTWTDWHRVIDDRLAHPEPMAMRDHCDQG